MVKMVSHHAFVALALCIFSVLPASSAATAPATRLYGSGGTTVQNIFSAIIPAVNTAHKVAITYNPIGSGIGREEFINGTSAFCESDVPMPALEESRLTLRGDVKLTLPYLLQTISIFVYLPNNYQNVYLTSKLLAQIYQGQILYWADARIVKLNPTLKIAATQQIHVVYRSDPSGSTNLFTEYLGLTNRGAWKLGTGSTVAFPKSKSFFGAQGSSGVGAAMRATPFSIGYLGSSIGRALSLNEVYLQNAAGQYLTTATADLVSSIPRSLPTATASWASVSLLNSNGKQTWPITSFVFLLARQNAVKLGASGPLLRQFLHYLMTSGQAPATKYSFSKLPTQVANRNKLAIREIVLAKGVKTSW